MDDRALNDRDVGAMTHQPAHFGQQRTMEQVGEPKASSLTPADWSQAQGRQLNKSAVVAQNTNQTSMKLPDKLQKFRDRVKRDRSANVQRDQSRDDSLYGRKKTAGDIDRECQRLRESYGKHRKLSTASNNGQAVELLHKQNFREDPFDRDGSLYAGKSRGSASYDRNLGTAEMLRISDKENTLRQSKMVGSFQDQNMATTGASSQTQINRYKRT